MILVAAPANASTNIIKESALKADSRWKIVCCYKEIETVRLVFRFDALPVKLRTHPFYSTRGKNLIQSCFTST